MVKIAIPMIEYTLCVV